MYCGQRNCGMKSKIDISILITHYNRPQDLLSCIEAIKKAAIPNSELIISDDCSETSVIDQIKGIDVTRIVYSDSNKGLAANLNKGIKACSGDYILYCQEDFMLRQEINTVLDECLELLKCKKVDLIRFTSNIEFNRLIPISATISLIPKFSFRNWKQNHYQYSDHPFITKRSFYEDYGYYQEGTSGRYGETEFGVRIWKSKARIAITNKAYATVICGSVSTLLGEFGENDSKLKVNKKVLQFARTIRLFFERSFYSPSKRGLITYKNARKV